MAEADATQRELSYRKRLVEIANLINSAPGIPEILVDLKDPMLDLVEALRVTLYALDTKNQELFSLFKAGQEVAGDPGPQDLRLDRGLHRPLAQDGQHQGRLRRAGARPLPRQPALRRALGQVLGIPHEAGAVDADRLRQVPPGRPPAHQQARRHAVQRQGRAGRRGAGQDPGDRLLQPAPRRPHQQAVEVRRPDRQGAGLGEGPRDRHLLRPREPDRRGQGPGGGAPDPEGGDPERPLPVLQLRALGSRRRADAGGAQGPDLRGLPEEERVRPPRAPRGHACEWRWRTPTTSPASTPSRP